MPKQRPHQQVLIQKLFTDPLTDRRVCEPCFNMHHEKCQKQKCNCMHLESVKNPRTPKGEDKQESFPATEPIDVH